MFSLGNIFQCLPALSEKNLFCVPLKFLSLDHGMIATCPVSVQTSSIFLPACLCFTLKRPVSTWLFLEKSCVVPFEHLSFVSEDVFQSYCIFST